MIKTTVRRAYVIENPTHEEIVGTFYEKELPKPNQTKFKTKRNNKKGNKLYVKWKGYSFNRWTNQKDIDI